MVNSYLYNSSNADIHLLPYLSCSSKIIDSCTPCTSSKIELGTARQHFVASTGPNMIHGNIKIDNKNNITT